MITSYDEMQLYTSAGTIVLIEAMPVLQRGLNYTGRVFNRIIETLKDSKEALNEINRDLLKKDLSNQL